MSKAITGHRYRHYKKETMVYTVLEADAIDCEDLKPMVVYRKEYEGGEFPKGSVWIRAKDHFEGKVTLGDGSVVDRFTDID